MSLTSTVTAEPIDLAGQITLTPDEVAFFKDAILTLMADERLAQVDVEKIAVLPSMFATCNPDLVANANGEVVLAFDKPLPEMIWFADYDPELRQLVLVTVAGQLIPFGMKIHDLVDLYLREGQKIFLVEVDNQGKIIVAQERKVIVRRQGRV